DGHCFGPPLPRTAGLRPRGVPPAPRESLPRRGSSWQAFTLVGPRDSCDDELVLEGRPSMSTIELEQEDVVGPAMAGTLMSPEEFDAIEDWSEGYVFELIHGVLVVSPP